jgi:hypothetical protein
VSSNAHQRLSARYAVRRDAAQLRAGRARAARRAAVLRAARTRRRTGAPGNPAAALAVVVAAGLGAAIGFGALRELARRPVTPHAALTTPIRSVGDVADRPKAFRSVTFRLAGRVAQVPASVPAAYRGAFVLSGDGGRVLVVPAPNTTLRPPAVDSRVIVRATVVRTPRRKGHGASPARAAVVRRTHSAAVIAAREIVPAS